MDRFRRLPVIGTALAVNDRYGRNGGGYLAASLTYYGFLSTFPLILLALAGVGFVLAGDVAAQREWAARLSESVPGLGPLIGDNIQSLVEQRGGAGVIGLVGLLWSGTALTNAGGYSLSRVFRRPEVEGFVQKKVWSLATTLGLGLLALTGVAISAMVGGLTARGVGGVGLGLAAILLSLALDVALFLVSYRVLTAGWGPHFSKLWPGALLAGGGWTALKTVGAWYASRTVAGASEVYGTFGSVVGILAVLYLASRLFLYGAELNAMRLDGTDDNTKTDKKEGTQMREERRQYPNGDSAAQRSVPELVGSIASDVGTLVRKEVELARQEIVEAATARLKAIGAFGAAGVLGLLVVIFASLAAVDALNAVVPLWTARLIVAACFLLLTGGAAVFGVARMKHPSFEPEMTKQTVKEDIEWAKTQLKR